MSRRPATVEKQTRMRVYAAARMRGADRAEAAAEAEISAATAARYELDADYQQLQVELARAVFQGIAQDVVPVLQDAFEAIKRNLRCGEPKAEVAAARLAFEQMPRWARLLGFDLEADPTQGRPKTNLRDVPDDQLAAELNAFLLH